MELVNESLRQVPFDRSSQETTYLQIETSDRQLAEVREFKQQMLQALKHGWSDERGEAEARSMLLRKLVERLSSQEPEHKRRRESVL